MKTVCNVAFVFVALLSANCEAAVSPLFASDEPISVIITAPMRELIRHRMDKPELDGLLQIADPAGASRRVPIKLSPRGRSRLAFCDFPPLRIELNPEQAAGTLFEGQRKLKLVSQCKAGNKAANWLLLEYGIYRGYNAISDFSFRVRRLNVTFLSSDSKDKPRLQSAFLIEPEDEAAQRLQREAIYPLRMSPEQFQRAETAHNMLFQYLIGNTDFEVTRGPSGEPCCHNGVVLAAPGRQTDWVVLPYDFDQSGLMHTDYAVPYPKLPIGNVTTRLYRGFCWHDAETMASITLFNDRRDAIVEAMVPEGLARGAAKRARRYLDRFYEIVNDPQRLNAQIVDRCRGPRTVPALTSAVSTAQLLGNFGFF